MKFYCEDKESVIQELNSSEAGLSSAEAGKRLEANGKNKLAEGKKESLLHRFFKQLAEPMTIILLVAAAISAGVEIYNGVASGHWEFPADVVIIMAVVLINAILGVFQESKAEKAIEALQEMSKAQSKVLRDGHQISIPSEDLVVGDVIILEAGDAVPADARIIECASMKIEEAALTGESVPVDKKVETLTPDANGNVALGDRKNMVFMGSTVVYGRGKAVVTATGMDTEMGKIADALAQAEEGKTPLQIKLAGLSKILTYLVIAICVIIFGVQLGRAFFTTGTITFEPVLESFMIAISLAVAAIPEGLATVVTIVLSIGVTNMSKRNAIIRKLTAVETLGCTQIICSDKTGTLTQNKMTVVDHYGDDETLLATAMSLCSDAEFDVNENTAVGEPTECALVNYAQKLGLDKNVQKTQLVRIGEVPFDSGRKMMSTVHRDEKGSLIQFTKGAPDEVLKRCSKALVGNTVVAMTDEIRASILASNKAMADQALRVLMAAKKELDAEPAEYTPEAVENDLCFVGLVGMIDPVRPEVKPAIDECRSAGIRPIMITGDHKDTAVAIAMQLGIITDASQAITGAELDEISDEEFETAVEKYSVYARVQPEHKTRIVNAWRKKGKVTAMTGDGVNDAPSIKNADIGVGMGITGTDVTKNVADMILADDNFATIVSAVGEGRRIYDNIRKAIQFLLASNLSEVLSIFFATLLGFTIFQPVHLLWINLITDCFPALALGMEKPEADVMNRKPRDSKEGIFAGGLGFAVAYQGALVTLITLASYLIGRYWLADLHHAAAIASGAYSAEMLGTSMAFLTLSMCEIFHAFNMRSLRGSIFTMKGQNKWLWGAGALSLLLTTAVVEIDFLCKAFELAHLDLMEYGIAMGLAILIIPIVELVKLIQRQVEKKKA
ncbi:MAG: cation-translocating P-type ATPase [Clostridia bacterium]|nr:cation-translocating P-type ATPase [Clostridia bacterium]MBQ5662213.1 cation-translocating P-type ATPase [Clostridia bacterium]